VVAQAAASFASSGGRVPLLHWHHPAAGLPAENGYFRLSRHFKWALDQVVLQLHGCMITCTIP
jgi:hypothetical protein